MSDSREAQVLRQVEALFSRWGIDTARSIEVGGLRASLVAYGYPKAVVVLIKLGKPQASVSFTSVTEAITLREQAADALDRETIALLLTEERVPEAVREALRDWSVGVVQLTDQEETWLRRLRQALRDFSVLV